MIQPFVIYGLPFSFCGNFRREDIHFDDENLIGNYRKISILLFPRSEIFPYL